MTHEDKIRNALAAWCHNIRRGPSPPATKHLVTNTEIHCDGETAWVSSDFVTLHRAAGPAIIATAGRFVDRFVETGSGWQLSERTTLTGRATPPRDKTAEARAAIRGRTDEEGVRLRLAQYNQSLKDGRLDDLTDCWTRDGVFTALGVRYEGRTTIREFLAPHVEHEGHMEVGGGHLIANSIIELDGDRARATTDMFTIMKQDEGWEMRGSVGRYVDRLLREADGVWRFAERTNVTSQW